MEGMGGGEADDGPESIFWTWLDGKRPCFPRALPVHQSALVSSTISTISPAEKERSLGSCSEEREWNEKNKRAENNANKGEGRGRGRCHERNVMRDTHPTVLVVSPLGASFLDVVPRRWRRDRPACGFGDVSRSEGEVIHAGDEGILWTTLSEAADEVGGFGMSDVVLRREEIDVRLRLLEDVCKEGSGLRV